MRLRHPDGQMVHLASVVDAYTDRDLPALLKRLTHEAASERKRLDVETLDVALRLSPAFAGELAGSLGLRRRLQHGLTSRGLEVVTIHAVAAHRSWRTWWTHALDLARVLVDLMPEDVVHGSVSAPLPPFDGSEQREAASRELDDLAMGLTEIAWHTGRFIRVAVEPAPDTPLKTSEEVGRLLGASDTSRIGVCLSPAQVVLSGETPAQVLADFRRAGLSVVKIRISDQVSETGSVTRATLTSLLGGPHAECDHLEVAGPGQLDGILDELAVLGLDGATDGRIR